MIAETDSLHALEAKTQAKTHAAQNACPRVLFGASPTSSSVTHSKRTPGLRLSIRTRKKKPSAQRNRTTQSFDYGLFGRATKTQTLSVKE